MNRIKDLRKINGYTQSKLAKILNTTQANLSGWENGKWEPDSKALAKMADLFNVSVDYLLERDTPTPAPTDNIITEERLRALGIDTDKLENLSDEQLSVIRTTLSALLDSFKKSNK